MQENQNVEVSTRCLDLLLKARPCLVPSFLPTDQLESQRSIGLGTQPGHHTPPASRSGCASAGEVTKTFMVLLVIREILTSGSGNYV